MRKVVFVFLVLISWSVGYAQVTVSGTVKDDRGQPLWGANVILSGTGFGVTTDMDGRFMMKNVSPGTYNLKTSFVGLETYSRTLKVESDMNLDVVMHTATILADEVLVKGTRARPDIPVTYSNLSGEKIEENNLGQDMPYLINLLPSVVVTSDAGNGIGYSSFRVRGTDLTRINVTLNGIPLNDSESHGVWWVDLPDLAASTRDIQLQRGVGTSTNGAGAFGATLNLQTSGLEKEPFAKISASAGSYNSIKNSVSFGSGLLPGGFSFDGRYSAVTSDGYIERASSDLSSFAFTGAYYGQKKDILKLVILSGKEKTYQSWDGVPGEILSTNRRYNGMGMFTDQNGTLQFYDNETDNYRQNHFQLFYSKGISPDILFNAALHYTHGEGYYEQYKEDESLSDYLLQEVILTQDTIRQTDLIRRKWLNNDFYGAVFNLSINKYKFKLDVGGAGNKYVGDHYGRIIWARYFSNGEKGHEWYRNQGVKTDGNLYAKTSIRINQKVSTYLDIQGRYINYVLDGPDDDLRDISQEHSYFFFNPKAGLKYLFSNSTSLYGSVAIAHREPDRYTYKDTPLGEPAPRPERLTDFEAGIETGNAGFLASANIYYMWYKDQLVHTGQINDVGAPVMTNVPESYRFGIELIAAIRLTSGISWNMNATFSRNKIKKFSFYIDDWDTWSQRTFELGETNISFSPGQVVKSSIDFKLTEGIHAIWNSVFVGKQYIDNSSSDLRALNPYWVNDLRVNIDVKVRNLKSLKIHLGVNNLLNELYESNAWVYPYYENNVLKMMTGYYPQAERNFMAGINVEF